MDVESFNLAAPAGFRGLHPDIPVTMYHRHLPHWRQKGATYFVTFRLADALPQTKLRELDRWREHWEREYPPPHNHQEWEDFARQIIRRTEAWLDEGYGECVFRRLELAQVMADAMLYFQDERCVMSCYTVRPNHVHVAVKPLGELELEYILGSWKGYVGHKVNRLLGRSRTLWQEESYDRIIRDEEHLFRVVQYIGNNPAKAGLPRACWHRWIHPDWQAAGWDFRDG
jgi:hypothetical protein